MFSLGSTLGNGFSVEWIRAHTRDAHEILKKPVVLEEFGATGAGSGAVINSGGGVATTDEERGRRADVVAQYYREVSGWSAPMAWGPPHGHVRLISLSCDFCISVLPAPDESDGTEVLCAASLGPSSLYEPMDKVCSVGVVTVICALVWYPH